MFDSNTRKRFLELLAIEYGVDNKAVEETIEQRLNRTDKDECRKLNFHLRNLLVSPRVS